MAEHADSLLRERFAALANPLDDSDWIDVRRRAHLQEARRRLWLGVAAALAALGVLLATPALGLRGKVVQLFESGEPAPERIVREFASLDVGVPPNISAPGVIAGQTRKVMQVQVAPGREAVLWVAPTKAGGFCTGLAVREIGRPGGGGASGCNSARQLWFSPGLFIPGPVSPAGKVVRPPVLLEGSVLTDQAMTLEMRYEDGERTEVPLVWVSEPIDAAFFVYSIPRAHWQQGRRPAELVILDGEGRELARDTKLVRLSWPKPYRLDGIPIEAVIAEKRKVIETKFGNGDSAAIWVAPSKTGGQCEWLTVRERSTIYSNCQVEPSSRALALGTQQGKDFVLLYGHAAASVAIVELRFENGEIVRLQPADGLVLHAISPKHFLRGTRLELIRALDQEGREVGRQPMRTRERGLYPCDNPIPIGGGQSICP